MAKKTLPVQDVNRLTTATYLTDANPTPADQRLTDGTLTSGDQFQVPNDGKLLLHVKNAASAANFVFDRTYADDGVSLPDRTVAVPANSERFIRDFPPRIYGDTLEFAIDDKSNVELAILRLP